MKKNKYRMASWWLFWDDLLFPEAGIEKEIAARANKFKLAGINTVVIYGCHFRWDYIYNWERLHQLLKFIVDSCHKEGIKVFDHHSANLTHRVNTLGDYSKINMENRHHVPFFPSREFADSISFNGHKLNDFRMLSVRDGKACYLNKYNAEIFCMNNTDFVDAYKKYLEKLLRTGIDGLMCDDVIYYPEWDGCACNYCREKFKNQYGHDLPPATDKSFWNNYKSPVFKDWMNMRYHDPLDFLSSVKESVGENFPLMSCCSSSSLKVLNAYGMSAEIMCRSLNNVMLEICGEIVSENSDYSERVSDFMLHKAIADQYGYPNIGLGYAHNPDSAFVVWAFNKIFASNTWISTLTGRFGIAEKVRKTIPDEADIIKEAYNFEKEHERLFCGESSAGLAVLFSLDNLMYNGCSQEDYSQPWRDITAELFRQNIQFDVVIDIPKPDEHPVLLLSNFDCVSSEMSSKLLDYMKHGGTIVASGPLDSRNERGIPKEKSLSDDPAASSLHHLETSGTRNILAKIKAILPQEELEISCPDGWIYRIMQDGDKHFIHLLALDIEALPYKNFKHAITNTAVIEKLNFMPGAGKISFHSSKAKAVVHSPDLVEPIHLKGHSDNFSFELNNIKRYLIIEI